MTTLLFDFDGTLADSLSVIVAITNRLAPEYGYQPTPLETVDTLKGLSARQLIRYLGIPVLKIPSLLRRLRIELKQHSQHISPCPGIPATIRALHGQHYTLAVVTSNMPGIVQTFLEVHELQHCFIDVMGGSTLFRKGKLIVQCLDTHQLVPSRTIYIGDEVRDVEAARAAGIRSAAVTWGFNSREALVAANPDWLVDEPAALRAIADTI